MYGSLARNSCGGLAPKAVGATNTHQRFLQQGLPRASLANRKLRLNHDGGVERACGDLLAQLHRASRRYENRKVRIAFAKPLQHRRQLAGQRGVENSQLQLARWRNTPTAGQLADKTKLSEADEPSFIELLDAQEAARRKIISATQIWCESISVPWTAAMERDVTSSMMHAGNLVAGKITWGEYNKRRMEITATYRAEYAKIAASK